VTNVLNVTTIDVDGDVVVQGQDISLNHGAVVQLRNGRLDNFWYYTDQAGSASRCRGIGYRLKLDDKADKHAKAMKRLAWVEQWLDSVALASNPDYVGVEDYALHEGQGAHQLGEVGGVARLLLWKRGTHFRLHDPVSVKMFATFNGTSPKDAIEAAVADRWGWDFGAYNGPSTGKKPSRRTSEDLADAYAIAVLVWTEVLLRHGIIQLHQLHPKEVQVFNRVTATYPTSLLSRDWIHNEEASV